MGMFAAKHYAIVGLHIEVKCYYPTCLKYRIIAILNTPCFLALSLLSGNNLEKKKKKLHANLSSPFCARKLALLLLALLLSWSCFSGSISSYSRTARLEAAPSWHCAQVI